MFELAYFFWKRSKTVSAITVLTHETATLAAIAYLAINVNFTAAFFSFILPFNLVRFGMMQGNWVQHSFIERSNPFGGGLHNSITLINCQYNRECFNDGYHASHHLHPRRHFLDHPAELLKNRLQYFKSNAIVFKQTSYDELWFLLMTKNYETLADKWVHVGTPQTTPSKAEIMANLKEKTLIFTLPQLMKNHATSKDE